MANVKLQSCLWSCDVTFVTLGTTNCVPNHSPIRQFSPSTRKWYFQSAIVNKIMYAFLFIMHAPYPCPSLPPPLYHIINGGEKYKPWNFSCNFLTFLLLHLSLIIPWASRRTQQRIYYGVNKWKDCSQKPQEKCHRDLPHPQPRSKQNTSGMSSVGAFFLRFSHSFKLFIPICRVECEYQ